MRVAAVLFDIDGTLVDSNALHVAVWEQAFAEGGYRVAPGPIAGQIGKGADNLVPALLPDADAALSKSLGERHGAIFKDRYLDQVRAFPQARELVERTHMAGLKVVLASSASRAELDHYVALLDIAALVDASTTIDDVPHSKPSPDIFLAARDKLGASSVEALVVVGDSPYDMAAAEYCGMRAVALRSGGFSDAALTAAGAESIHDGAAALLARFDQVFG